MYDKWHHYNTALTTPYFGDNKKEVKKYTTKSKHGNTLNMPIFCLKNTSLSRMWKRCFSKVDPFSHCVTIVTVPLWYRYGAPLSSLFLFQKFTVVVLQRRVHKNCLSHTNNKTLVLDTVYRYKDRRHTSIHIDFCSRLGLL